MRLATHWRGLALGIGAYALALLAMAPATLADAGLQSASMGRLRLAEARGTLWSGAGQFEIRDALGRTGMASSLNWHFLPAALLRGRLAFELAFGAGSRPFPVSLTLSRIEVDAADISLPAAALGSGVAELAPLELSGELRLQVSQLSIGRGDARGNATLQWRAAGAARSPVSPLGDYELRLHGDGTAVRATLLTLQGPLQLDGQGSWASGARPVFLASARPAPAIQHQLAPFLRLISVENGDGSFALQFK